MLLLLLLLLQRGCVCGDGCGEFDRDSTGCCAGQEEDEDEDAGLFPTARCSSLVVHPCPNAAGDDDAETTDDAEEIVAVAASAAGAAADGLLTQMVDSRDESL